MLKTEGPLALQRLEILLFPTAHGRALDTGRHYPGLKHLKKST